MAKFGEHLAKRLEELRKIQADIPNILAAAAETATVEAVSVAVQNTPPNNSKLAGTNTRSGDMAQHWETDSVTKPVRVPGGVQTMLANNLDYASYVNDGHRMDKHFVPGLVINSGMLEKLDGEGGGGITVGTKTKYVRGLFITEKAKARYQVRVISELDNRTKEAFK